MTLLPFFFLLLLNVFIIVKTNTPGAKDGIPEVDISTASTERPDSLRDLQVLTRISDSSKDIDAITDDTILSRDLRNSKDHSDYKRDMNGLKDLPSAPKDLQVTTDPGVSSDDTITMVAVVLLFLCCNTLALFVNVFETFFEPDALVLNMLTDTSNFLVILNSSVNCIIYLIFNKEYRAIFM